MHPGNDLHRVFWQAALAAVSALLLSACQASLAERTPDGALLPLPEGVEMPASGTGVPADDPVRGGAGVGASASTPPPVMIEPLSGGAAPLEPRIRDVPEDPAMRGSSAGGMPPPPPPPVWSPAEDQVVRVLPDGRRVVERLRPDLPAASGQPQPPAPVNPRRVPPVPAPAPAAADPWLPGAGANPVPPAGTVGDGEPGPPRGTPQEPAAPASPSDGLGAPPGGGGASPLPAAQPAAEPPTTQPEPPAAEGPWLPPTADRPLPRQDPAPADALQRAFAHATRLTDRPGARDVRGFPPELAPSDDAGMALTPGSKPALLVFYDDGARASDLQAARLLPLLVRLRSRIDFVAVDRSGTPSGAGGAQELARRYLDGVPTVVVLDKDRQTRLYSPGMTEADRVERALMACLGEQVGEAPQPGATAGAGPGPAGAARSDPWQPGAGEPASPEQPTREPLGLGPDMPPAGPAGSTPWLPGGAQPTPPEPVQPPPSDPWLPGGAQPTPPEPVQPPPSDPWLPGGAQPTPPEPVQPPPSDPWLPGGAAPEEPAASAPRPPADPNLPPAGMLPRDPFADLPDTPERPEQPAADGPDAPVGPPDEGRGGVTFTPPGEVRARDHAARLRSAPGEAGVPGYPVDVITGSPAERVLASGSRPCVVIFHDDGSKASDLQAAEFLPLLVRRAADVDVVLVDVSTQARWDEAQKRVVRTYYNFYVPTTVVLAPNRAPIKSWYSRIKAADLERAIDQALQR